MSDALKRVSVFMLLLLFAYIGSGGGMDYRNCLAHVQVEASDEGSFGA